ncbi:MAG TPA: hypothetical protein VGD05_13445 [Pyrinomonadaceae bacterium]|jgi:hypothetical protein
MKKIFFSFILFAILTINVFAQAKAALKIDEFSNYNCEDMLVRLDYFANDLMKEPNVKGFVIVYEGKYSKYVNNGKGENKLKPFLPRFGESAFRTRSMQNHLLNFRTFPKEKFLFISGGFRENHTVELWIVPNGENPPKPTATLENIKYRKGKPEHICAGIG